MLISAPFNSPFKSFVQSATASEPATAPQSTTSKVMTAWQPQRHHSLAAATAGATWLRAS